MRAPLLIAAAILVLGSLLSLVLPEYYLRLLNLSAISAVAVIGLNFAFGYAGLISLGHAAFVGMGAYGLAILTTTCGWSPWLAAPAAVAATAVLAALIGFPLLRLRGHYLALATLGLNVSFYIVTSNWISLTGGTNGIARIPDFDWKYTPFPMRTGANPSSRLVVVSAPPSTKKPSGCNVWRTRPSSRRLVSMSK